MELSPVEILQEVERQFPLQLQICVQAVQIRKLQEPPENDTDNE
jgi:hypothetical protein|tara:strand:+ start:904 stop:1035 length:132 start_codon:yes stop_codon:yes gene_type:complete